MYGDGSDVGPACQAGLVLLADVAITSAEVGAVSARTAKIGRIAELLAAAASGAGADAPPTRSPSSSHGSPVTCRNGRSASVGPHFARCRHLPLSPP